MPEYDSTIEYRPVKDFPAYMVGSDGSVWTCWQKHGNGKWRGTRWTMGVKWRQLVPGIGSRGHLLVTLCPGRRTRLVHRLVLEAFVGPCPDGLQCCHFPDRDPSNNVISNIRWGTPTLNQSHRAFHGTDLRGSKHPLAKLTEEVVRLIRREYAAGGVTQKELAERHGVKKDAVSLIICRKAWKHVS